MSYFSFRECILKHTWPTDVHCTSIVELNAYFWIGHGLDKTPMCDDSSHIVSLICPDGRTEHLQSLSVFRYLESSFSTRWAPTIGIRGVTTAIISRVKNLQVSMFFSVIYRGYAFIPWGPITPMYGFSPGSTSFGGTGGT